jgi:DNA-binding XRE family transcriptional regulator
MKYATIGKKIMDCRKNANMDRYNFAQKLKIGEKTLGDAERGEIKLNMLIMYKISALGRKPLKWLIEN